VTADGTVMQNGGAVGQLQIVGAPSNPAQLRKEGGGFSFDRSGLPGLQRASGSVRQGYQEDSNVNPAESSMRLIQILRQFEGLQRAMQIGGEMSRKTIEEVARVTP
jgi:flagellar basal body rod protein FlgG